MLRRTFLTATVVLFAGAVAPSIPAGAGTDPAAFINNLGNQLRAVTSSTSREQRLAGFQQLFREDFDVPGLGRFVLGRFWRIFTPTEQQEFLGLFENYVVLTYSEKLSDYAEDGGRPSVTGCRRDPDGAIVSSKIIRQSSAYQPIQVDWRLTAQNGSYKVGDIVIDGLSMAANGRSQLEGVVERNGGRPRPSSPSCGNRLLAHLSIRSAIAQRNCKPSRPQPPPLGNGGGVGLGDDRCRVLLKQQPLLYFGRFDTQSVEGFPNIPGSSTTAYCIPAISGISGRNSMTAS